jgi:predicted methyltransferase
MIWKRVLAAIKEQRANHAWRRWKASGTARLAARVVPTDRVQYAAAVRRSRGSLWEAASSKWRDVRYMPGSERRTSMIRIAKSGAIVALTMIVAACGQEPAATEATALPDSITAAVADANRPTEQRELDAVRSPAEVVAFSGMEPGDVAIDYRPGGGYYTRIFSKVVGPEGRVYATESTESMEGRADRDEAVRAIAADPAYPNVTVRHAPFAALDQIGEPVDIVWTSNNYHDIVNDETPAGMAPFHQGVFRALKPGGTFFIVDHAATSGSGYEHSETLHRIDEQAVIDAVQAAGFVLDARSDLLARPADDRSTQSSFESAQLILRFRKPE